MAMPRRTLTPDEKKLWKLVMKDTRRLSAEEEDQEEETLPSAKSSEPSFTLSAESLVKKARAVKRASPQALTGGKAASGIDRNTQERLRKGKLDIDGKLDLHGMKSDEAKAALQRFILRSHAAGKRALLVVTGKGKSGEGVLKRSLPDWLSCDEVAPLVLAFSPAQQKDGGGGAYYILLRRKR